MATLVLAAALLAGIFTASAHAAPTISAPTTVKMGHGFTLSGRGFPARALVTLRIGPPRSESYYVTRVRTTRAGRFTSTQRVLAPGRWVWTAGHGRTLVTRQQRVRAGVTLTTSPAGQVHAGSPFTLTATRFARGSSIRFQAQAPGTKRWTTIGSARQGSGRTAKLTIAADNPLFATATEPGEWQLRACTNRCRVNHTRTRVAMSALYVSVAPPADA